MATFELRHEVSTILKRRHTDSHILTIVFSHFSDCGFCIDYSRMAASNIYDVLRGDIRADDIIHKAQKGRAGHS